MVRLVKGLVLLVACLAMVVSVVPLFAEDDVQDPGSGQGTAWKVTCVYSATELISRTCTSGGSFTCACP